MYYLFFIPLSKDRHLVWLHIITIVTASQYAGGCRYPFNILISFPLPIYPEITFMYYMVMAFLNILVYFHTFYNCKNLPTTSLKENIASIFITTSPMLFTFGIFNILNSRRRGNNAFTCISPGTGDVQNFLPVTLGHWCLVYEKSV